MDQVIMIQEVIQTGLSSTGIDMDGSNFQDGQKVEFNQNLEKLLEHQEHQEKGWLRMLRCLDREVTV